MGIGEDRTSSFGFLEKGGLGIIFWADTVLKNAPHQHGSENIVSVMGWGAETQKQPVIIVFHGFSGIM